MAPALKIHSFRFYIYTHFMPKAKGKVISDIWHFVLRVNVFLQTHLLPSFPHYKVEIIWKMFLTLLEHISGHTAHPFNNLSFLYSYIKSCFNRVFFNNMTFAHVLLSQFQPVISWRIPINQSSIFSGAQLRLIVTHHKNLNQISPNVISCLSILFHSEIWHYVEVGYCLNVVLSQL